MEQLNSPKLTRTLNEHQWLTAEEEFQKTRKSVLVWKETGWEFWVEEYIGQIVRTTIDIVGNEVTREISIFSRNRKTET